MEGKTQQRRGYPCGQAVYVFLDKAKAGQVDQVLDKKLFVMVGNRNMQQVIGIPMGTNCAPFLANILLYMYELEFFEKFVQENDVVNDENAKDFMRRMSCCTRYIDDLWNVTVAGTTFQQATVQMYPDWLKLGDPEDEGTPLKRLGSDRDVSRRRIPWECDHGLSHAT